MQGANNESARPRIVDDASLDDADDAEAWSRPVVSFFPFSFDTRVNATQDLPIGSRIWTEEARSGALMISLREAGGVWLDGRLTVRLVNVERSDDGVRPIYARDAVATARLSQGSLNNLIVVPFGDVWMPTRTVQAFLRWEQGGATQGIPSTGLIDIQLVLRSNPTPTLTPRSFKEARALAAGRPWSGRSRGSAQHVGGPVGLPARRHAGHGCKPAPLRGRRAQRVAGHLLRRHANHVDAGLQHLDLHGVRRLPEHRRRPQVRAER